MAARGKRSSAEVASQALMVSIDNRLAPPAHIPEAQREIWVNIVNAMPATWFTQKDYPLMIQLMQHIENASNIQAALSTFPVSRLHDPEMLKTDDRLTTAHERETRAITSLYRSFRITQQSEYRADKARTVDDSNKPWDN